MKWPLLSNGPFDDLGRENTGQSSCCKVDDTCRMRVETDQGCHRCHDFCRLYMAVDQTVNTGDPLVLTSSRNMSHGRDIGSEEYRQVSHAQRSASREAPEFG